MDASDAFKPKAPLLKRYYPYIFNLNHYLNALIPSKTYDIVTDYDPETYRTLLATALVATHASIKDTPNFPYISSQCSQSEVGTGHVSMLKLNIIAQILDRVHGELFKRSNTVKGRPQNVLAFGYRIAQTWDEDGKLQPGRLSISNYAINSMVTTLTGPDWSLLLQRIGERPMLHLLLHTSLFLHLQHGSFCQATGKPICNLVPISRFTSAVKRPFPEDLDVKEPPEKRQKLIKQGSVEILVEPQSANNIKIAHSKILYCRPQHRVAQGGIHFGLPLKHVLNRLGDQDTVSLGQNVDGYLAKYIFPRQFGLGNVFLPETQVKRPYGTRAKEIKDKGAVEIPRRLQPVLQSISNLLHRHKATSYFTILEGTCPSKLRRQEPTEVDILEFLSRTTQATDDQLSTGESPSLDHVEPDKNSKPNIKFAEYTCTQGEVTRFALKVTSEVIPKAFWGTDENFRHISKRIAEFIECRRYENLTLHGLLQNLQLSKFDWAFLPRSNENAARPLSDTMKGRELVEEFLYWYFDSFLIPLLKALCKPLLDKLRSEQFVKVPRVAIFIPIQEQEKINDHIIQKQFKSDEQNRRLGHSSIRLLPKETGARLIINLGKRQVSKGTPSRRSESANQILRAALHILNYEKHNQPALHGATVNSHSGIYFKLKEFKNANRLPNGLLPKLYFVKVDLRACFDSIEQGKLLDIIKSVLKEKRYMIQRYAQVHLSGDKIRKNFVRRAFPDDEHRHFLSIATELAASLRHVVFADQVWHTFEERKDLVALIEEHVSSNIVEIGGSFYKQKVGISQGSVISTILCNYFYGDLESSDRFDFLRGPANLLLRYIDDYFFVSTYMENARQFLEMMDEEIVDALTVEKGRVSGSNFRHRILSMATSKNHLLFMDTSLNTEFTVYLNIYENFLMMAMK
ncbi:hypothetical protein FRC17_011196, partial [Serendipita sp. 399]